MPYNDDLPPLAGSAEELDAQINDRFKTEGAEDADFVEEEKPQNFEPEQKYKEPSEGMLSGAGIGLGVADIALSKFGMKTLDESEKEELTHSIAGLVAQVMPQSDKILSPKAAAFYGLSAAVFQIVKNRAIAAQKENMRDVTPQQQQAPQAQQKGESFF